LTSRLQKRYGSSKDVLVTGASQGIGQAFARDLASAGYKVTMVSRDPTRLNQSKDKIQQEIKAANLEVQPLDLSAVSSEQLSNLFSNKKYSIVVNNAGVAWGAAFFDRSP